MANLIREQQDYLFNTVSTKDFGMYYKGGVKTGEPHFVIKSAGIDIPCGDAAVKVLSAQPGAKQVVVLTPTYVWDGSKSKVFNIEVTRQPLYSGFGNEQFPVSHTYSVKVNFVTSTLGTLDNEDKEAIVAGLYNAILADVKRTPNAVNTGAVVVPTKTGSDRTLTLTAKEDGVIFTVKIDEEEFSQSQTTAPKKATLTNDDVARIFAIKAENEGQRVNTAVLGKTYAKVQIIHRTKGYDNTSATAYNEREQTYNLYIATDALDSQVLTALAEESGGDVASMTDGQESEDTTLAQYFEYIGFAVLPNSVEVPSTGAVKADTDFDLGALVKVFPAGSNNRVTFSSATVANVTVDANGICKKGSGTGNSVITVTTINGKTATCTVTAS